MQRSNSGSLFPTSFYAGKRPSQSEQAKERTDSVDAGGDINNDGQRERLLSRSYPENEFRNLARISESEPHEATDEHPVPLSNPSEFERGTSEGDNVFEVDSIKRRSLSENNLTKPSFKDELATRLTMEGSSKKQSSTSLVDNVTARPPSIFKENATNLEQTLRSDEDLLRMKIDLSPERGSVDPFNGKELSTFMTVPSNKREVSSRHNGKLNGNVPGFGEPSKVRTQKIHNVEQKEFQLPQETKIDKNSETQPVYPREEVVSKLNNNYKEVSEMLVSDEKKATGRDSEEPTSPMKKSFHVEADDMEENIYDFKTGKENVPIYRNLKENFNDVSSAYTTDKNQRFTNTSEQDYNRDYTSQGYTRQKSDGFAVQKVYNDENMFEHGSRLNTRRKSEGFPNGAYERTGYEEFGSVNYTRPKSEAFTSELAFKKQKEVSLDHPRKGSREEVLKPDSEFARRRSEGFVIDQSSASRVDGFERQNEISLDHPRRRSLHNLSPGTNQNSSGRHVLPNVLLDTSRDSMKRTEYDSRPSGEDFDGSAQIDRRVPPPYRPPPGLTNKGSSEQSFYSEQGNRRPPTRPSSMPPAPPTAKEPPPYRMSQDSRYSNPPPPSTGPNYASPDDITPIAPPRKHRRSVSSEDSSYPPVELSPTAPPRKHRSSGPRSSESSEDMSYPPKETSLTASPRKNQTSLSGSSEILEYPPAELSPTAPPRKHRGSIPRSSEDVSRTSRPSYPPPSYTSSAVPSPTIDDVNYQASQPNYPSPSHPSYVPPSQPSYIPPSQPSYVPPSRSTSDYTLLGRLVDHSEEVSGSFEPDDTPIIVARSYNQEENNAQSGYYQQSQSNEYSSSARSSNYRRSDPTGYNGTEYGNFQPQSSNFRRSEGNEYRSNSNYPQTSSFKYSTDSGRHYPLESSSNFEPTVARDQFEDSENRSLRDRTAFSNTSRDQSPSDEVVVARSVMSQLDDHTNHPEAFRNDSREPSDYIPTRKPQEMSGEEYSYDRRNDTYAQESYENEFDSVIMPKYEGYTETRRPEMSGVEPEFIVAKQMPSRDEIVTEARPIERGSQEDTDFLPGVLRQDTKNKWMSNSSDGSNESSENRNKYRMTSMI